jgi:hypothetical protein
MEVYDWAGDEAEKLVHETRDAVECERNTRPVY